MLVTKATVPQWPWVSHGFSSGPGPCGLLLAGALGLKQLFGLLCKRGTCLWMENRQTNGFGPLMVLSFHFVFEPQSWFFCFREKIWICCDFLILSVMLCVWGLWGRPSMRQRTLLFWLGHQHFDFQELVFSVVQPHPLNLCSTWLSLSHLLNVYWQITMNIGKI